MGSRKEDEGESDTIISALKWELWLLQKGQARAGGPQPPGYRGPSCRISGGLRLEIKCTINVMHLNPPGTMTPPPPPPPICGKALFHENSLGCQKKLGTAGLEDDWHRKSETSWEAGTEVQMKKDVA